jgi:Rrf2 family protein
MISRKGKYAIRAMLFLAREFGKGPANVERIASSEGMPKKFLEAIMLDLKVAGVVQSLRGKSGGFRLQKSPSQITVGSIIRAVEGSIAPVTCVSSSAYAPCSDCPDEALCAVRLVMLDLHSAIGRVVDLKTLDVLLRESEQLVPGFTIDYTI